MGDGSGRAAVRQDGSGPDPDTGAWIDLYRPDAGDGARVERETGLVLPTLAQLSEVEISSRLRERNGALYLALPLVFRSQGGRAAITPVGFILSPDHLVTVRFEDLSSFHVCRQEVSRGEHGRVSATGIFATLLEAITDRLADMLEETAGRLDKLAEEVFGSDLGEGVARKPKREDARLRRTLRGIGRGRQLLSKIRATLLGIGRIVPYVQAEGKEWVPDGVRARLETVRHDIESLDEYETHLSDRLQFLLDADLGFINMEQNDRFRVLTVVSVVGIPPTLIASMYGMNFKHMPELDWTYGYPYGLALIALSALVPMVYFRVKGWL